MAADFSRMTVLELRQELKRRNLPQTGKKADLVDRLTANENENGNEETAAETRENDSGDKPDARDSEESQADASTELPPQNHPADSLPDSVPEDATHSVADISEPTPSAGNELATPTEGSSLIQKSTTPGATEKAADTESIPATEIITDAVSRKRRSRSPPPENEASRKRPRPADETGEFSIAEPRGTEATSGEKVGKHAPIQVIGQETFEDQSVPAPQTATDNDAATRETSHVYQDEQHDSTQDRDSRQAREPTPSTHQEREADAVDEPMPDYERDVAPAQHPATSALYIKNFMRPLREPVLRDYLVELAALPGAAPDPDCVVDFHLDQIRTHAFTSFTSVSAASRVRTALHGTVWPNERNRKELWVDFVPEDKVAEWIDRELSEGGRGSSSRWEVRYEPDDNGDMTATLVNAEAEPPRRNSTRQPLPPPSVPTGPARNFPGVEGAPLGPRGRGTNHYRQAPQPTAAAPSVEDYSRDRDRDRDRDRYRNRYNEAKTTRAHPPLQYKPVSEDTAAVRLDNMNQYITKDRYRDLGRPDEINRYTFENGNEFVDRGKEAFIGIRPPHRERERRRMGITRGGGGPGGNRGPPPPRRRTPSPRRPSRDDDGPRFGGGGDRYRDRDDGWRDDWSRDRFRDDVPRSRFDGQPLPTFSGGGGRGGRRGGGGGGRRF